MTKRKESEDYQRIKSILRSKNKIKEFHHLLNQYKYCHKSFKLNQIDNEFVFSLILNKEIKICKYIERLYLMDKFNEDKLKTILYMKTKIIKKYIKHIDFKHMLLIFYFRNLPLKIYQEFLYKDINTINHISSQTKCYDEIRQIYGYLKI